MSHSPRRILLVAVLVCCFFVGSLAPAASEAQITNADLMQKDQKILDKLGATQDMLRDLDAKVDQVLTIVNGITTDVTQLLDYSSSITCSLLGICANGTKASP